MTLCLMAACASLPPVVPGQVCYSVEEDAALRATIIGQNEAIEEMHWRAFLAKRKEDETRTRIEGLKGYCS